MELNFLDKVFKVAIDNRNILISSILEYTKNDISFYSFIPYLSSLGEIEQNKLSCYLENIFSESIFYSIDFQKPYRGGVKPVIYENYYSLPDFKAEELVVKLKNELLENYLSKEERVLYENLKKLELYEERKKLNQRDKILLINDPKYKLFNISNFKKISDNLIDLYYEDFVYDKKISKRFKEGKYRNITDNRFSLCFDKRLFFSELKKGFIQNIDVSFEWIDVGLMEYVFSEKYLSDNGYPLKRIGFSFVGIEQFSATNRIADYTSNDILLDLFFNFHTKKNMLKIHIDFFLYCVEIAKKEISLTYYS